MRLWLIVIVLIIAELVLLWLVARWSFRVGVLVAMSSRRRIADVAGGERDGDAPSTGPHDDRTSKAPVVRQEIPEIFRSEEDRRQQVLRQRYRERAGRLAWNYARPGISKEEREALMYSLESGKLDAAIEQIVREEMEES